jgi:transposase
MIPEEARSRIRRLFFAEHWKVGTISAQLGVHHDAVRHAINAHSFLAPAMRVRAELLDPYRDFIRATLERYPKLCSTRLLEMVQGRGYTGSVFPIRRFVARVRPNSRHEAFFRLSVLPGEQAQVDWASFGSITVGRAQRKLYLFIMVLAWSRAVFARFYVDQTTATFLAAHVAAFEVLGGVPRTILYDNLKSVVLERDGDLVRFHPRILEIAGHYHFAPKPCAVARGNEKGRVERRIRDIRESFFAARTFHSRDDLNAQLAAWIDGVQRNRLVPGDPERRLVRDAHAEEKKRLLPLPEHRFSTDLVQPIASGNTPYVRFDRNDYSVPHTVVRKPLTIVASETTVRLLDGAAEVARHARSFDAGQQIEDEAHLRALAQQKRKAREHRGRNRLSAVCPAAHDFLSEVALHGGHLGGTTARLLRLLDTYGAPALDLALREAHGRGAFRAESVAHVLDQRHRAEGHRPAANVVLTDDPRVRDQHVEPHRLEAYDDLATAKDRAANDANGPGGKP